MGLFGAASIGVCAQCGNKAEVATYPGFNPQAVCENCQKGNEGLEQIIAEKQVVRSEPLERNTNGLFQSRSESQGDERELYIRTITNKATDEWLKRFIKEVVVKQVLRNDWKSIIRNERWFSLLDLRRFALDIDPDVDRPEPPPTVRFFNPERQIKRSRPKKKTQLTKEPIDA